MYAHTEKRLCEDSVRRRVSASLQKRLIYTEREGGREGDRKISPSKEEDREPRLTLEEFFRWASG